MRTYQELLHELRVRSGSGARYGLERMQSLLDALDHPERAFPSLLIAGTNGKGSVSAMLEAIANAAGLRCGLNTSPHLNRLAERVRFSGQEATENDLLWAFAEVERGRRAAGIEVTFFETITAMAFLLFAREEVELAVVEVGLGGRLDATNLLQPEVSAVVSIGLDHTRILGSDHASIAAEKAAIARQGRPLVIGALEASALDATLAVVADIGARPVLISTHLQSSDAGPHVVHPAGRVLLAPNLGGAHQIENAAVASLVALEAGIEPSAVEAGLRAVRWRGRLERLRRGRDLLLDCAHNVDGARALGEAIPELAGQGYRLVTATSGGRDSGLFVATLSEFIGWPRSIWVCRPGGHRVADAAEVARRIRPCLPGGVPLHVAATVSEALAAGDPAVLTLVTGSMYLVGEALALLDGEDRDPFETGR